VPDTSIQVFESPEFGQIRTAGNPERPEFCAKDIATALGYKDTVNAIKQHCKGVAIYHPLETAGGKQDVRFITEGDMYRLIVGSKLDSAQRFESWVFDEILPAIRRDGGYIAARDETPEETMARAVLLAQQTIERQGRRLERLKAENAELTPKAGMFDACMAGERWQSFTEVSRLLHQYDRSMTRKRLFELAMRDHIITRDKQASKVGIDRGYVVNYQPPAYFDQTTGEQVRPRPYAKVTSKGVAWMTERYCKGAADAY
jgi:anti-repressor protein